MTAVENAYTILTPKHNVDTRAMFVCLEEVT